jgi:hypothetical protein
MNGKKIYIIFAGILSLFLCGCYTVEQTIYLQDVRVSGPLNQTPLQVTTQNKTAITITPRISFNNREFISGNVESHTTVNETGVYQIDTIFNNDGSKSYQISDANNRPYERDNLRWNIARVNAGLDMDFQLSNVFALTAGVSYAADKERDYFGGTIGFGLCKLTETGAIRFDAGIIWQNLYYDAATVVVSEVRDIWSDYTRTDISFFRDRARSRSVNPYFSLTYNSAFSESSVNFLLSLGFFTQTVLSFEPQRYDPAYFFWGNSVVVNDKRGESMASFITLTPGLIMSFGTGAEIVAGVKILHENVIGNSKQSTFISPTVQFNFNL